MNETSMLVLKPVETKEDVENLRLMRNVCKNFMTRNTSEISYEQQQQWYQNIDKNNHKLFLLHQISCGVVASIIGYGYIRVENDVVLLTGGLIEQERGKGYGTTLFEYLVKNSEPFNLPIKLEVLKTNMKAFAVYNKIGFRVIGDNGKIIEMEYHYDSVI
jgi:ribosomal protein S18 acetylase RimI-like enzyme